MAQAINLENLCFAYERNTPLEKAVLKNLNLLFNSGEIVCIAGKTGAGKSTLIQNLDGLLIPTSGKITYEGGIVVDMTPIVKKNGKLKLRKPKKNKRWKELRQRIGIVFQFPEDQLFKNSVLNDVMVGPLNFGCSKEEAEEKAKRALREVGLDESFEARSPFVLSGGEKRRAAIAGVLAFDPQVLILDEPTVGLDSEGAKQIEGLIAERHRKGQTIIIVTHDMDLAYKVSNRLIVLKNGQVFLDENPVNLFQQGDKVHDAGLLPPKIFVYSNYLRHQGYDIDMDKARDAESLACELKRVLS